MNCVAIALMLAASVGVCMADETLRAETFTHDGLAREYLIAVPPSYRAGTPTPLVFVLHGGGGQAMQIARGTKFHALGAEKGFITVYPQAVKKQWNDDREEIGGEADDVGFILALTAQLGTRYTIDPKAIFAAGMSNGGFMCQRLACEAADRFAAIASVVSQLPEIATHKFAPKAPISVLLMNGTEDPIVPYAGGIVKVNLFPGRIPDEKVRARGKIISAEATAEMWRRHNDLPKEPVRVDVPDRVQGDGVRAETFTWSRPDRPEAVVLYRINGGGHTYPGDVQRKSERITGKRCRDFDATSVIWSFFDTHRKP